MTGQDALDEKIAQLEREELSSRWQRHRMFCLKLAAKLGATTPEEAVEMAEALSTYILNGRQNVAL
jgi:hypothetical protein